MTNQTPVEYCRHENCGKEIARCLFVHGTGYLFCHGWVHKPDSLHFCDEPIGQVAEPADPPQQRTDAKLPFQRELTVIMQRDRSDDCAERDLQAIKDGTSTVLRLSVTELYFHHLRLRMAEDPELVKKIAIFFADDENKLHEIKPDNLTWPPNFCTELWDKQAAIMNARKLKAGTQMEERKPMANGGAPIHAKLNEIRKRYRDGFLGRSKREQIDAEFAGMATDEKYQTVCKELNGESANHEPQASRDILGLQAYVATVLRFEPGDEVGEYFIPADPGPLGPYEFKECLTEFMKFSDEIDAKAERELQELRAEQTKTIEQYTGHIHSLDNDNRSLRGLVGRMLERMPIQVFRDACGFIDERRCAICLASVSFPGHHMPIVHLPDCLISEAEAAIKETHNG